MGAAPSLESYLFVPPEPRYTDKDDQFVRTAPGHGSYLVEHKTGASRSRGVMLYFHANACDCGSAFSEEIRLAFKTKMAVLAVEYPGYGALGGARGSKPSVDGANEAAKHAFRYANEVLKVHPSRMVFFARSLGTGIAMNLARILAEQGVQIGAIILAAPFMSLKRLVKEKIEQYAALVGALVPFNYIMQDEDLWDNGAAMTKLKCPVLIIHGHQDEVIPVDHSYDLVEIHPFAQGVFLAEWGHDMGCAPKLNIVVSRTADFLDEVLNPVSRSSRGSTLGCVIDSAGREYICEGDSEEYGTATTNAYKSKQRSDSDESTKIADDDIEALASDSGTPEIADEHPTNDPWGVACSRPLCSPMINHLPPQRRLHTR